MVHLPSFFNEVDTIETQGNRFNQVIFKYSSECWGLNCNGRLFISDRAHLVFDFHQIVDGLKEVELGGSRQVTHYFPLLLLITSFFSIGTTKKGIGPAYSGKASRSGLRVHHLFDHATFAQKFRKVVEGRFKRYGYFEYDTEGEILRYQVSLLLLKRFLAFPLQPNSETIGTGRETSALRRRQCRLYTRGHFGWQESLGRRRQRIDAWPRFRYLSLCDVLFYQYRRCVHWPWNSSQDDRTCHRGREGIYYSSWWRAISHWTAKRQYFFMKFSLFSFHTLKRVMFRMLVCISRRSVGNMVPPLAVVDAVDGWILLFSSTPAW